MPIRVMPVRVPLIRALAARALHLGGVAALLLVGGAARAEDLAPYDPATKSAIQTIIKNQLDAFEHGDGAKAESFATPALRTKFPEPAQFLAMVKTNYAALIHSRSTSFGPTEDSPHGPLQSMTVVAADGTVWKAVYAFEKVDGEWRISGCGLQKDENQQAI